MMSRPKHALSSLKNELQKHLVVQQSDIIVITIVIYITGLLLNIILILFKVLVDMCKTTLLLVPDIQATIHITRTVIIGSTFQPARPCKFTSKISKWTIAGKKS